MVEFIKNILRGVLDKEAARFIAYGGTAAIALAVWIAGRFGYVLPQEILDYAAAVGVGLVVLVIELIRHFVFSAETAKQLAEQIPAPATDSGLPVA